MSTRPAPTAVATSSGAGLGPVLEAGGPELARLLARTEGRLGAVIESYGDRLAQHAAGTLAAGGKRLRPILVYLCAGAAGGPAQSDAPAESEAGRAVVHAGAAVELLHMATLVHDDVLDRAALRRGRPTVFRSGGRTAATATGDLLFSRAFAELVMTGDPDAVRALSRASTALAHGELMQRADAWRADVDPDRYLERCELKTARLFEAACRLGAILGRPGPEAADALGAFGSRIGIAFQIFDDVLDVAGPAERTGKRRGTDLLDGTVTLPLILARRRDRDLRALDLREVVTDPAQAEAVCDRIALSGALGEARGEALHHVAEAKAALSDLSLTEGTRHALDLVADGVVERYS
ncbi:MAG: Heptaprenyl diphosphate synthase component II [uncultured Solirubrobacterales bacterium]|uniref:Heptaprenyl diphosphate synthase component II n=1 Tax=uncultured Solirubrobacterales bacterium TaxID=768556 RepID=A0A6J4SJQ8_9ACTN|nr:MAG: Heptaprenyl diphosphate synthase component II [uncultured Solirubrobacterales bacterium]